MRTFCSYKEVLKELLSSIVVHRTLHAKWLNTLSYLENCGARKIAACEHPTQVKEEMLKHASEEFRHAHYLKRQIERICASNQPMESIEDYSRPHILGGIYSYQYLHALDIQTSSYLSRVIGLPNRDVRELSYLLVTYAIELRADELYPLYDEVLRKFGSKITVRSIVLEEKEHLQEMKEGICKVSCGISYAEEVCFIESRLCKQWLQAITREIESVSMGI